MPDVANDLAPRRWSPPPADLTALQSALLVREHASFRRASETLGIDPSVLSRRILALEENLGVALFQRDPAGARPTDAGALFLAQAEQALRLLEDAVSAAAAAGRGKVGILRLGHSGAIVQDAEGLLGDFWRAAPDVEIYLHDADPSELVTLMMQRRLDAVFVSEGQAPAEASRLMLGAQGWRLAMPMDAPLHMSGWPAGLPILCLPRDEARLRRIATDSGGRTAVLCPQGTSYEGLMTLVAVGVGCALVPQPVAERASARVRLANLPGGSEVSRFAAVWLPDTANPALRRFLSLIRAHALAIGSSSPEPSKMRSR